MTLTTEKRNENEDVPTWDEIPYNAYMALGQRGMEKILLQQCFVPGCEGGSLEELHPLKKVEQIEDGKKDGNKIITTKYLIHCDHCQKEFYLVFTRHVNKNSINNAPDGNTIIMEQVSASDPEDNTYGQIGFLQSIK